MNPHGAQENTMNLWLVDGGEMGKLIRSTDWSKSPLGPIESWPQSLRTAVGLSLASNFPISITWGPRHIQIYNDGYWPICGGKHPRSMGQDFSECWASAWPVIGEAFEKALSGETSFLEDQRMFLDRNGYLEETFFTFSFSPIRDESGNVAGLFHPVMETTSKMLSERRGRILRDLSVRSGKARTVNDAFAFTEDFLSECSLDLPFTLSYLFEPQVNSARLVLLTGLPKNSPVSMERVNLHDPNCLWPLLAVLNSGQPQQINGLEKLFNGLSCGPYPELPKVALALPIKSPGVEQPIGVFITGISSRLFLKETYRTFCDLVAASITNTVANASAYEEERKRAEALAAIDQAKTVFFSNVSHEFRTPLTLILGPLEDELAENANPLPKERYERLETAYRNSLRLLKLVNTLLDFSRLEAGRVQANYVATDLALYTSELASVFRSAIEKANLKLVIDCPSLSFPIYVDQDMWEKIVLNLLSNALKHTFSGEIKVSLKAINQDVVLTVSDSGVGIADTELPKLFERFHRVTGAKSRSHEGTGIGLALVSELVKLHKGKINVTSQENVGSVFTVTVNAGTAHLPKERITDKKIIAPEPNKILKSSTAYVEEALRWSDATMIDSSQSIAERKFQHTSETLPQVLPENRPTILWVDDNTDMREYVSRLLISSYEVITANNGEKALSMALDRSPDLILSDVMMPAMDGFELLERLRADVRTKGIPVILLSARAGEESAIEGLNAGADYYLAKPFSARELLAVIKAHLNLTTIRQGWARELADTNRELEAFSFSVSHDLRAPLRVIEGFSAALTEGLDGKIDDVYGQYLKRIKLVTQEASTLIDDMLRLAKVSKAPLYLSNINLTNISQHVITELQSLEPNRSVHIEIMPNLNVVGDKKLIEIALRNLISNAWKFSKNNASAVIEIGRKTINDKEVFYVSDNGVGFDMTYADQLFKAFSRLHRKKDFDGTGVGLATVQRIVSRHHGDIWVEAAVDKGATFFFTLKNVSQMNPLFQ